MEVFHEGEIVFLPVHVHRVWNKKKYEFKEEDSWACIKETPLLLTKIKDFIECTILKILEREHSIPSHRNEILSREFKNSVIS